MIISYRNSSESQRILKRKFPTRESFVAHFIQTVSKKRSHAEIVHVLDYILSHINLDQVKIPYRVIAHALGLSRKTVYRAVKALRKQLLIWTIREKDPVIDNRYDALTFEIPCYFYDSQVRTQLQTFLSSMKLLLVWTLSISIDATGQPIRESVHGFSYSYIREEKIKSKNKIKRRLSCIIMPRRDKQPDYSSEICLKTKQQPPTSGNQLVKGDGMRMILSKVTEIMELTDEHIAQLDLYSDDVINRSLKKFKESKNATKPVAYFFGILRNVAGLEHQQPSIKQQLASSQNNKSQDSLKQQQARASLNDRCTAAEIEHCEKLLQLFDKISIEDPSEAQNILYRKPSSRWSLSWPTPDVLDIRLEKLRGNNG